MVSYTDDSEVALVIKEGADGISSDNVAGEYDDGTSSITGKLVISEYSFESTRDHSFKHGIGNQEPMAHSHGNEEYELSFTLEGEDASLFNEVATAESSMDFVAQTPEGELDVHGLSYTDFTISGSDGEMVTFDATMAPLSVDLPDGSSETLGDEV